MHRTYLIFILILMAFINAAKANGEVDTDSLTTRLQEIVVTAKQPATRLEVTSLVTTIPGSSLAEVGNGFELLAQLPMITVTDETIVNVTGKGTPAIYIDGRPLRDENELRSLRSDNIRRVELDMAPGAQYDSSTTAVIKIITKKNFIRGLSIIEEGHVAVRHKISAHDNLDISYHGSGYELFASGFYAKNNSRTHGMTVNTFEYNDEPMTVGSVQNTVYPSLNGSAKVGFNLSTGAHSFGGFYRFHPEVGDINNNGGEWFNVMDDIIASNISRHTSSKSHLVSVYYDGEVAEKYHLHFDGLYTLGNSRERTSTVYPEGDYEDVTSTQRRHSSLWGGKITLDFPLGGGRFVTGSQCSYTHTSLDYRMLNEQVGTYLPSSFTDVRHTSSALFASWNRSFGPLSAIVGARYEYLRYAFEVNGVRDDDISHVDHLFTPDVTLGYTINDDASIRLSYKAATVKPPYSHLTGGLSYTGVHQIEGGNTSLRDERMHNVQLFGMWKDFMLQGMFVRSLDTYAFVKELYPAPSPQLLLHPVNVDVSQFGCYVVWGRQVGKWSPNLTLGYSRQWLEFGGRNYEKPFFIYFLNNTVSLPWNMLLTADISGQSSGDMHTNRFRATWFTMDASVKKSFLGGALALKISATDIFNTMNNDWSMLTNGVHVVKKQKYDRRGVMLTLTYKFQPKKSSYKGNTATEEESRRL